MASLAAMLHLPAGGDSPVASAGPAPSLVEVPPAPLTLPIVAPPDEAGAYGELEPVSPALFDQYGRVRLSFSRMDTYQQCPTKFRYGYLEAIPTAPSPHLSFGSSVHAALERFYDHKLPSCPGVEQLLAYLYDVWDSSGFAGLTREQQLAWYRHAQEVLRRFHARESGRYRLPADVEKWFELPLGDALVVGSIDRVDANEDGSLEVIDYKTNKHVKDRDRVRTSLQLAIYALACEHLYGRLPGCVTLYFVVPGIQVRVTVADIDLDAARQRVAAVAAAVRDGRYPPRPSQLCAWCDYRRLCPAWQGDGPEVLGPAVERLEQLRRQVRRDVRALRELEAGVARLAQELEHEPKA